MSSGAVPGGVRGRGWVARATPFAERTCHPDPLSRAPWQGLRVPLASAAVSLVGSMPTAAPAS